MARIVNKTFKLIRKRGIHIHFSCLIAFMPSNKTTKHKNNLQRNFENNQKEENTEVKIPNTMSHEGIVYLSIRDTICMPVL